MLKGRGLRTQALNQINDNGAANLTGDLSSLPVGRSAVHAPVPAHAPLHPLKVETAVAVAVSVTIVPEA